MMKREVARRIFASELNDANIIYPHDVETDKVFDQKSPKYALTPIGTMVNRIYLVGRILGEIEESRDRNDQPFYKLKISDGVSGERQPFYSYVGTYQQQPMTVMDGLADGDLVAVVGKVRGVERQGAEEGDRRYLYSLKPETIISSDEETYRRWLVQCGKSTLNRVGAYMEVKTLLEPTKEKIMELGYAEETAKGLSLAVEHYETIETEWHVRRAQTALNLAMNPEYISEDVLDDSMETLEFLQPTQEEEMDMADDDEEGEKEGLEGGEGKIMVIIKDILDESGEEFAPPPEIIRRADMFGIKSTDAEELVNSLYTRGIIYGDPQGGYRPLEED